MLEKCYVSSRGHIFSPIIMKLDQHLMMKSGTNLEMDHLGSKTTTLDQILEKPCVHFGGRIFSPIVMKLGQSENGLCQVKN